jgi:hypothetical protein
MFTGYLWTTDFELEYLFQIWEQLWHLVNSTFVEGVAPT